jgi:hypothetical protein
VRVRVRAEPVGTEAKVDNKGSVQLDLPPRGYDVVLEAAGYVTQCRQVQVEPKGVVALNVDLARALAGVVLSIRSLFCHAQISNCSFCASAAKNCRNRANKLHFDM